MRGYCTVALSLRLLQLQITISFKHLMDSELQQWAIASLRVCSVSSATDSGGPRGRAGGRGCQVSVTLDNCQYWHRTGGTCRLVVMVLLTVATLALQ